jgi:glycosyltransferase involved in cell wall biosynthesis
MGGFFKAAPYGCGFFTCWFHIFRHIEILIENKRYSFFARDATPQSLADAIRRAHAERSKFNDYAVMARQQVLDHHTWRRQAERLKDFLLTVVNSHRN